MKYVVRYETVAARAADLESAQRFAASDPLVVEGLVRPGDPLGWNA